MRSWRKIKRVLLIAIPLCFIGVVWMFARKIVNNSGLSFNDVKHEVTSEGNDVGNTNGDMVVEKEFEEGTDKFRKATVLFDDSNLEERQKSFLGDDFNRYKTALLEIADTYQVVFDKIPDPDESLDYSGYTDFIKYGKDLFSGDYVGSDGSEGISDEEKEFIYIPKGNVEVIGLYGEMCVVYRYKLDDEIRLFVVDYTNSLLNTEVEDAIDFGDTVSLLLYQDNCLLLTRGNYKLLYLKEF